jgi:formate hydrogenlyase subunit 3/multisubunit Na+/H+ antiporter MnhD subunit
VRLASRSPVSAGRTKRSRLKMAATLVGGIGLICLVIVVLTHVAEALHIFPSMGWGLPNSPGHYLDFVSAILGVTLIPLAFLIRRKNSK